ncbi:MAG: acetyl-CoA carboxylase carboxyltransferase subunit alpha [Polyangiaceae bacterium]
MASVVLPFEQPIVDLLERLEQVKSLAEEDSAYREEADRLQSQVSELARELLGKLSPIEKVQLSRHPKRPYTLDYVERIFSDWVELKGDRRFSDDASIVGGMAKLGGRSVMVVGHQKGRGTKENVLRNFGMPHPEGYRKAIRLFELADKFGLPIVTLIDTPGAYPGIGAEERGQSEAIGASIACMARVKVPVVAVIIGEGGSGGALALGVANRVLVLEFGCYSVISPEGCAAILWKDGALAGKAAEQLKITAQDLLRLGVVDEVIGEPSGGAHQDYDEAGRLVREGIVRSFSLLDGMGGDELVRHRYDRFRALGAFDG